MWVTDSRMLCSLPGSCLVPPIWSFDSDGLISSDRVIFLTVFRKQSGYDNAVYKAIIALLTMHKVSIWQYAAILMLLRCRSKKGGHLFPKDTTLKQKWWVSHFAYRRLLIVSWRMYCELLWFGCRCSCRTYDQLPIPVGVAQACGQWGCTELPYHQQC